MPEPDRLLDRLNRVFTPKLNLAALAFSIIAMAISLNAQSNVTDEARARADQAEVAAEHQRLTFCAVFETIAEAGKIPTTQPRTQFGESILKGSQRVVSPEGLSCTPDPFDGR